MPSLSLEVMRQRELADWMAAHPESKWAQQNRGGSSAGAMVGLGCAVVFGLGYPIFCLAWFAPKKHSPEIGAPEIVA